MGAPAEEITGTASPSVLADGGNAAAGAATAAAAASIEQRRKRGRPSKQDTPGASPAARRTVAQAQAEMTKALEELYDAKHWVGICKAPADLMLALGGDEKIWNIPKPEIDTLAAQTSLAARYVMVTDPKWVALTLFAFSLATTYGSRTMLHLKQRKEEMEA